MSQSDQALQALALGGLPNDDCPEERVEPEQRPAEKEPPSEVAPPDWTHVPGRVDPDSLPG